jgi:hypothetical protein
LAVLSAFSPFESFSPLDSPLPPVAVGAEGGWGAEGAPGGWGREGIEGLDFEELAQPAASKRAITPSVERDHTDKLMAKVPLTLPP